MDLYRLVTFYYKGLAQFSRVGYYFNSRKFCPDDLNEDCSSKSFMITGANSGIGFATALKLACTNATVHLVCRNERSGTEAKNEIIKQSKNNRVHLHIVDMSKPKEILGFKKTFAKEHGKLDVLINNAGALFQKKVTTSDGLDANFATSTLGYYLMTKEFIDILEKSDDPRVVMVSSGGMLSQKLDCKDFNFEKGRYNGVIAYAQTKRQQVVMCKELATRYPKIFFASMHPGWADTPGVKTGLASFYVTHKLVLRTPEEGADTAIWLAMASFEKVRKYGSGEFFLDRGPSSTHLPFAGTESTQDEHNEFMEKLNSVRNQFTQD